MPRSRLGAEPPTGGHEHRDVAHEQRAVNDADRHAREDRVEADRRQKCEDRAKDHPLPQVPPVLFPSFRNTERN